MRKKMQGTGIWALTGVTIAVFMAGGRGGSPRPEF
jgi:hypothetical protein